MNLVGTQWKAWKYRAVLMLVLFLGLGISGCGSSQDGGDPADCVKLEQVKVPSEKGLVALVVDNTASAATGDLPPRIVAELKEAQRRGDVLALISVEGVGKQPAVVRKVALEPNPGVDSVTADNARPIVLDCVARWARAESMRPTASGSAVLDAIGFAARQKPSTLLVMSDGVNSVSPFDINELGFDTQPEPLARALATSVEEALQEQKLVWAGLGETTRALPQSARANLKAVWTAVLATRNATADFDQQTGKRGTVPDGLPTDSLVVPEVKKLTLSCGVVQSIPSALLFGAESSVLLDGADEVLKSIAAEMTAHQDMTARIEGHTADFGTAEGKQRLSEDRAKAVALTLASMGVDTVRLEARGFGSDRPKDQQDPAAATNRRVEITLGTKGCGR
ncbi:OmpA family protein [Lentzea sp. HUAS TT2]|uniref:OmpA family protein n=1 Tax=Lentzea sp. HUAS TT2 TaxID=3447454 RepID=UPI003F716047